MKSTEGVAFPAALQWLRHIKESFAAAHEIVFLTRASNVTGMKFDTLADKE
jgi:hypothetical protein